MNRMRLYQRLCRCHFYQLGTDDNQHSTTQQSDAFLLLLPPSLFPSPHPPRSCCFVCPLCQPTTLTLLASARRFPSPLSDLAQAYLVKLLQSYNGEDAATLAAQAPLARQAVLGFVRDVVKAASTTFLADVDAVRALSSDADGAVLLQLLDICTTKTVAAYQAFATANAARFAAWGLDNEACLANMRLLSLCSLAAEAGNTPVPFRIVANTLQVQPKHTHTHTHTNALPTLFTF